MVVIMWGKYSRCKRNLYFFMKRARESEEERCWGWSELKQVPPINYPREHILMDLPLFMYNQICKNQNHYTVNRSNPFNNPAPRLVDCFLSNVFFFKVQIVKTILHYHDGFISATRQLVKLLLIKVKLSINVVLGINIYPWSIDVAEFILRAQNEKIWSLDDWIILLERIHSFQQRVSSRRLQTSVVA